MVLTAFSLLFVSSNWKYSLSENGGGAWGGSVVSCLIAGIFSNVLDPFLKSSYKMQGCGRKKQFPVLPTRKVRCKLNMKTSLCWQS